jgi:hypothetical protein
MNLVLQLVFAFDVGAIEEGDDVPSLDIFPDRDEMLL